MARVPATSNMKPVRNAATCHPLRYLENRSAQMPVVHFTPEFLVRYCLQSWKRGREVFQGEDGVKQQY